MQGSGPAAERVVRDYYAALNAGDRVAITRLFADDARHYFTTLPPAEGGAAVAEQAYRAVQVANARFKIERLVVSGSSAVAEYTVTWEDIGGGPGMSRGVEIFEVVDGRIAEVRSYQHRSRSNPHGDLLGFDHAGRGYAMPPPPRRRP